MSADSATSIAETLALHPLLVQLLFLRGITSPGEIRAFLEPDYLTGVHDPFLFDDMSRAVDRIIQARFGAERITIYGDYDVDGLSSSALLFDFLSLIGCDVGTHINHRERDGYGLNATAINSIIESGTRLIITTDGGISNAAEIAIAQGRNVDVIITDHHTVPKDPANIPNAFAILHPLVRADRYPFKELSGGGVAFKFVQALVKYSGNKEFSDLKTSVRNPDGSPINWEGYEKWLLDLVCLSTIGDCVPLRGENRIFVKYGLLVLSKTRRIGLQKLLGISGQMNKKATARTVGFVIGPRLNAASRMDHAQPAFDLLIAVQEDHAETLAQYLNEKNIERQRLTERITQEATALLADALSLKQCTLVAIGDGWPISVLGLVAGKLCNTHNRPVVLLSAGEGRIAGAGRSPDSFHLANAFSALSELFVRHGGHRNAGGFQLASSVTPLDFAKRFEEFALLTKVESSDEVQIADAQPWDIEVSLFDCDETLLRAIQLLEPFGQNNPEPILRIRNACLKDVRCVGVSQRHARVVLEQNGVIKQGIAFSLGNACSRIPVGTGVDCLVALEENSWNGISQCQLTIKKISPCEA